MEESAKNYICAHISGKDWKSRAHIILERAESTAMERAEIIYLYGIPVTAAYRCKEQVRNPAEI